MLTNKRDYEEIYQKYKNLVMKAAYKYSGNYDIAEDITQSTFLQLYMYIDELKDINIKAWMYTTAKHMALNYNKKAEREVLSETGEDPTILDLEDSAEDTYMERMKDDEQTSLHEEIFAALYKHNPRWYDAIRYVYYLEIPQSAVAERMEISIEVLHSLLYRARKWIRKKFGVEYEEFLEL